MPLDHLDKNPQMRIISESRKYFWDAPYLFKLGNDGVMRRCVPREERLEILRKCHSVEYGGHYSHFRTQEKVWFSGFYWSEMHEDTKRYIASCPECQRTGNISQRNSMPLKYNLQIDLFDVWGIDFMGPFKNSHVYEHILVMVDYVSKWVGALIIRRRFLISGPSLSLTLFPSWWQRFWQIEFKRWPLRLCIRINMGLLRVKPFRTVLVGPLNSFTNATILKEKLLF
jgi:hypothetical protein